MCSTESVHGSRIISQHSDASVKDSGSSQVFFPPDFEGNSEVDAPISPVLEDVDNKECFFGRSEQTELYLDMTNSCMARTSSISCDDSLLQFTDSRI